MAVRNVAGFLCAAGAAAVLVTAGGPAEAGGFAIREQSASGQGASFAGVAAGGALSSMFWNPAIMTQYEGKTLEADTSGILPHASQSYSNSGAATNLSAFGYARSVDNSANNALVPAGYGSWQLNPKLWLGLSINSPFGLSVSFPEVWAGALYGQSADVKSYNFSPALAYKLSDMISVAAGLQVQYMSVNYNALGAVAPPAPAVLGGSGYSYGFTVGATITPTPTTTIGIGYRSALNQKITGTLTASSAGATPGSITTTIDLPDVLTVGLRQRLGDRFTLLAGFEWANWSRIGTSNVLTPSGTPALLAGNPITLPFQYSDGYFYSLGGEYIVDPALTVRAGIAFEKSPITDGVRTPRLPDNDRMWYSIGASYKPPQFKGLTFDLGYSFIDVKDTPLNLGSGTGNPWSSTSAVAGPYTGSVSSYINILSIGLRYQWDAPAVPKTTLYTK